MTEHNKIPQIILNHIETIKNPRTPRFQRDLAAQTLERVRDEVERALNHYRYESQKRG